MNTEMQVKKRFPATADVYPNLQPKKLLQGQNSPYPGSEEDAKASRPQSTPQPCSLRGFRRSFRSHLRLCPRTTFLQMTA